MTIDVSSCPPTSKGPPVKSLWPSALFHTQFDGLKLLTTEGIVTAFKENGKDLPYSSVRDDDLQDPAEKEESMKEFLGEIRQAMADMNKRFKITVKKKYINDIILMSKGAQNVAQTVILVVTNIPNICNTSPKKMGRRRKRNLSAEISSDEEAADQTIDEKNEDSSRAGRVARSRGPTKRKNIFDLTPQNTSSKAKAAQLNPLKRGYESENEAKSLNSTTTSSTFPNLKKGGNGA